MERFNVIRPDKPDQNERPKVDIESSYFRFTPEERKRALEELVPSKETRDGLSEEVIEILIRSKEEEIREAQERNKRAAA